MKPAIVNILFYLFTCIYTFVDTTAGVLAAEQPAIQLATTYREGIDVKAYWVSEKLDGVRAYWNGKQLISRRGHVFSAPEWFTEGFPDMPLDGELWISRGRFDDVSGIVRQTRGDRLNWSVVRLMIFDLPSSRDTFSERLRQMQALIMRGGSPYLAMIEQQRLNSRQALMTLLDKVVAGGGEGLMLHHGEAIYQTKRNQDLMKLKHHEDAEAVVLQHLPGKGKFAGMLGAIVVKTTDGVTFKIGSGFSYQQRENPPPIGTTITFKYYGKTANNVPRFASFMRAWKN